jgi:hypothetical protein
MQALLVDVGTLLAQLQSEILGRRTTLQQFGIRQSPVVVGEVIRDQEVVHYVAPPASNAERFGCVSGKNHWPVGGDDKRSDSLWVCLNSPFDRRQWARTSIFDQRHS